MKPLIVLLAVFIVSLFTIRVIRGKYKYALAARIAMSAMLIFTSIGHFAFAEGMAMMIPDFIPYKIPIVYVTGVVEILAAIGLLLPAWTYRTAVFLIAFFVLLLPANVYAAVKHVDMESATYTGSGPSYLWFRVPLQMLFILWTYFSSVKTYSRRE